MTKNKKEWLSDYRAKDEERKETDLSAREVIKRNHNQTQEVQIFLKSISKIRRNQREPYNNLIEKEQ